MALSHYRKVLRSDAIDLEELARAAPLLIDTTDRDALQRVLDRLSDAELEKHAGLAYAAGYAALLSGDARAGTRWLTRAQAALRPDEGLLQARIVFELGAVYLARRSTVPADVLLLGTYGSGSETKGDLVHLRALAADAMGDHLQAELCYRRALNGSVRTLSPATRVLAMINLAVSCEHRNPSESVALTDLAIDMISGHALHKRLRPQALNIRGYAQICLGALDEARESLVEAGYEAALHGHRRLERYAEFNQAIVDELEGATAAAVRRLEKLAAVTGDEYPDLAGWIRIRLGWLAWVTGEPGDAEHWLRGSRVALGSMQYAESLTCLDALLDSSAKRFGSAIATFESLCRSARSRGDALTEFAWLLRLAHLEHSAGRIERARRSAARALGILRSSSFRLSPNWWSAEIVDSFFQLTRDRLSRVLVTPTAIGETRAVPKVSLRIDGAATVDAASVRLAWQSGRTGSRVLRRMFCVMLRSFPQPVPRDALADRFWPDSEGDVAIRNLYAAVNDLRKVLTDLPGVRIRLDERGYGIELDGNATLVEADQARGGDLAEVSAHLDQTHLLS